MKPPSKTKNIPGRITATPTGLDVQAQTVTFGGVAYEIPAQSIAIEATDPAHFRLVLTEGGLVLDETPWREPLEDVPGAIFSTPLASFDLQPGQAVTEAACFNVARREGNATAEKTVKAGLVKRKAPSPAQVARRAQRAQAAALRAKLAEGRTLTPQEMSDALRALMGA